MQQIKSFLIRLVLLTPLLMLVSASEASAQAYGFRIAPATSQAPQKPKQVTVDEDFLKEVQKTIAERDYFREQVRLKDEIIGVKDRTIEAQKGLTDAAQAQADFWMKSALARKESDSISTQMVALWEQQLNLTTANYDRVVKERDRARGQNKFWFIVGGVLGGAAGVALSK